MDWCRAGDAKQCLIGQLRVQRQYNLILTVSPIRRSALNVHRFNDNVGNHQAERYYRHRVAAALAIGGLLSNIFARVPESGTLTGEHTSHRLAV